MRTVIIAVMMLVLGASGISAEECCNRMKYVSGTFIQLDAGNLCYTNEQWEAEFQAMKELKMDTLIVGEVARGNDAFCKLSMLPMYDKCGTSDPFQIILDLALKYKMKVYVGIYAYDWSKSSVEDFRVYAEKCVQISDDVWANYGSHKAFAGWYTLGWEVGDLCDVDYAGFQAFLRVIPHLRELSGRKKPIMMAPYFSLNCPPQTFENGWKKLLPLLDVDILAMQDGVGCDRHLTPENIKPYYAAMQNACKSAKVEFWSDLEIFDLTGEYPPTIDRIMQQMEAVSPYVKKIVFFEFNHYMSPVRGNTNLDDLVNAIAERKAED